jgi:hypothetical protein
MITAGESAIEGGAGFGTEGVGGSCWAAEVLQSAHKLTMIVAALMFLATVVASSVASALNGRRRSFGWYCLWFRPPQRKDREAKSIRCRVSTQPSWALL